MTIYNAVKKISRDRLLIEINLWRCNCG